MAAPSRMAHHDAEPVTVSSGPIVDIFCKFTVHAARIQDTINNFRIDTSDASYYPMLAGTPS